MRRDNVIFGKGDHMQTLHAALDDLAIVYAAQAKGADTVAVPTGIVERLVQTLSADDLDVIRIELVAQLADAMHARVARIADKTIEGDDTYHVMQLAAAVAALGPPAAILDAAPTINVERLAGDVWNACQRAELIAEHGGEAADDWRWTMSVSQIGDVAAAAVRQVLS